MFSKPKSWISGGLWKPKNPHSLEHLKYLYNVLCKNQTVTEQNRSLLVETLRTISEILIWGDQNDSSVFDFFLEKNMLAFFLRFMRQKLGRYICVQLLQLLNILFENIRNETSVYYLLSNNYINSIIVHKFDFSDEEVMAYYISFLKTLSLKLNKHTIHFFYNEHTNDFALYTEAIKFFNHPESMVRIAVRTITLNVYRVDDRSMLRYIRDKTAAPYFSNLVWFIGNHVLELDACIRHDIDHNSRDRLADLVAEHLDHLHYLNDILCLNIHALNGVLTDHLLNRLLIPLYVYSLTQKQAYEQRTEERPHVSPAVSLFLLSQVFLIMHHGPLVNQLAEIILNGDHTVFECSPSSPDTASKLPGFSKPEEPLAQTLDSYRGSLKRRRKKKRQSYENPESDIKEVEDDEKSVQTDEGSTPLELNESADSVTPGADVPPRPHQNSTDEEKLLKSSSISSGGDVVAFSLDERPYLRAMFLALECTENDYEALFALCLLYALGHNEGINQNLLDTVMFPTEKSAVNNYNVSLVEKLISIITQSCQDGSKVRLATLELTSMLLRTLVHQPSKGHCWLQDGHLAAIEGGREEGTLQLRSFYKSEEIFLDMFEDEHRELLKRPLNVEYLTMDASILLPPTGTPLTGIEFCKRLPCGEVERARKAIRVFFLMRDLSLSLRQEEETSLPLTKDGECIRLGDVLDLNNSDLIACTVLYKDNRRERRFLVIDVLQLILVEPDSRRLGWGVVKFVGLLQDVEVTGDKEDSRSLHVTIHKPASTVHSRPLPLLAAKFLFDDHIRCMAAKQRLTKGRLKARQRKMQMIARLLELPGHIVDSMYQPAQFRQSSSSVVRANTSTPVGRARPAGGFFPGEC
ncbi:hypothetical protein CAPTEDRAFT_114708 [Capitella teleta]|uniref:Uncharacterized protein n=1 Tax=Capitella teleta TaxID=283909 RepID=R7V952_CAPTE|nr:hypothetical protein CAPTEDRAFT_114708 [Capitella teleta]|eukprot:ELU12250.1 hypothetical protein CAPTEDRAFT_114708 [Capitella teleta]